mgnify:CR=1 FL=1
MEYQVGREVQKETLDLTEVADVKGYKALGSKFTAKKVKRTTRLIEEDEEEEPEEKPSSKKAKDPYSVDMFE